MWVALALGLLALIAAYQSPRQLHVDVGSNFDAPHVPGFHEQERNDLATYRWSAAQSTLYFEGIGKPLAPVLVHLQAGSGQGEGTPPLEVAVSANGHRLAPLSIAPQSALHTIEIDPAMIGLSGDLRLDLASPTFRSGNDRRDLGFLVDFVRVKLPAGLTLPALPQLLSLLLCAILLYATLRAVWLAPLPAGVITGLFLLAGALAIVFARLLLTIFTWRMLVVFLTAIAVAIPAELLSRLLAGWAGWRGERALPEWSWTALRGLLLATVLLKVGGVLYPHSFIIDAPFHLKYVTFAAEGRPFEEYFGRGLAFSVMPREEWGSARAFVPYSPFFYFLASPLKALAVPLEISVPVTSAIFESLKVALVFLVGLALRGARPASASAGPSVPAARLAVASAAVYAFIPATFLLQQWGNWPTLTSLWLLTLWAAITTLFWHRLTHPAVWIASTIALTLTMLSYTVTNIYTAIFIGMLVVGGWLLVPAERRRWIALGLSAIAAAGLATLLYYGQYIGPIIQETLPTFGQAIEEQGKLTKIRPSLGDFLTGHLGSAMRSYNLAVVYALALAGTLLVFLGAKRQQTAAPGVRRPLYRILGPRTQHSSWQGVWLGAWLLTVPLFTAADFYVDQAFKEFWYSFPAVALVSGAWLLALLYRGRASRFFALLALLVGLTLLWQSLTLWVFRLLFH